MQVYGLLRRIREQPHRRSWGGKPVPIALVMIGGLLAGCTSTIKSPPTAYVVDGNYEAIASCLYREAEGRHIPGRDVHLTRLSNPPEVRVASSSTGTRASLSWELELLPQSSSTARLLVRQAGTLVESEPFWSSYLAPAVTRCAGSAPVPTS